jgi:HSP20 family protein
LPVKDTNVPIKAAGKKEEEKVTAITPWRPEDYMQEMDRFFDDFARRFDRGWPFGGQWLASRGRYLAGLPEIRRPFADLVDSGKEYRVMVEVPGIPREKLDITITDREVRIEGEAKTNIHEENEGYVRKEIGYSKVSRTVTFPEAVIGNKAEASLNNGVLEVRVPKKNPTQVMRHKVTVK